MNLSQANLSQLQYLARYTDLRMDALRELYRRIRDEINTYL